MGKKIVRSLPLLTIHNELDGSAHTYINTSYVTTALQGLRILCLQGSLDDVLCELERLYREAGRVGDFFGGCPGTKEK